MGTAQKIGTRRHITVWFQLKTLSMRGLYFGQVFTVKTAFKTDTEHNYTAFLLNFEAVNETRCYSLEKAKLLPEKPILASWEWLPWKSFSPPWIPRTITRDNPGFLDAK